MSTSIMEYLQQAFATNQVSHMAFVQAFDGRSETEIAQFYQDLAGETQNEQDAFMVIVAEVGFQLPPNPAG